MSAMDYIMMGATIVSALLWLILGIMPLSRGYNSCTEHVLGTVESASSINYAGHHIPLCSYEVRGASYKVAGPLFWWGNARPRGSSNLTDREHLPMWLSASTISYPSGEENMSPHELQGNDIFYRYSALAQLYPLGSEVDIWYDPNKPERAYVQRPCRKGVLLSIIFGGWTLVSLVLLVSFLALGI